MIEDLLHAYFEGETSAAEEKELRAFFSSGDVPEHLAVYKPLFTYFDEEIVKTQDAGRVEEADSILMMTVNSGKSKRRILYWVSGIAASVMILLGIGRLWIFPGSAFCSENYVVINGRCYTDKQTIKAYVLEALQEVSVSDEDYFPFPEEEPFDHEIIRNQLRELGDLFNED